MDFDLNSIGSVLAGGGLSSIASRTKVKKEDVAKVLSIGIPALVGGMRRNAGTEEGEASLSRALTSHSADDISNPAAFLKGSDLKDGKKIVAHVLGDDQSEITEEISRATGVTKAKTGTILALLAPLLLSMLGNQNNSSSGGGLLGMLGGLLGFGGGAGQSAAAAPQTIDLLGATQAAAAQPTINLLGGQAQQAPAQQSSSLLSGLLGGGSATSSLTSGLLGSLLGGGGSSSGQSSNSKPGGLLSGLLNLLH